MDTLVFRYRLEMLHIRGPVSLGCVLTFVLCLLQLLTNHYEQNWKYYCLPSGWGSYGTASEDDLLLTKKLFWGIFDSLSQRVSTGTTPSLHFTVIDALVAVFNSTYTVAVNKE